ncbi:MAG: TIGR03986 family type III CRISPR-associated RAMP protein, partial [Pyrinomonadaceae bacterium]
SLRGVLKNGSPIFYRVDEDGFIRLFGHTPNFRVPYRRRGPDIKRASCPLDYVPDELHGDDKTDLAEAMFGYTRPKGVRKQKAYAGRVFVSDASCVTEKDVWLNQAKPVIPKILASPKPTTFQHYLVQPDPNNMVTLRHYASATPGDTVIRGRKLYWHRGNMDVPDIQEKEPVGEKDTQHTRIRAVRSGVPFAFRIQFENLADKELGALLWVLQKAGADAYRLKLGMGKPYGMGAVKIESTLHLTDRARRYRRLFQGQDWEAGLTSGEMPGREAIKAFERMILEDPLLNPTGASSLDQAERIQCLLAMLSWPGPAKEKTCYLEIEHPKHGNEYKQRPVLPDPLQVSGLRNLLEISGLRRKEPPHDFKKGCVKVFGLGPKQSYGFITPDEGGPDVVMHQSDWAKGVTDLKVGQWVIFRLESGMRGRLEAKEVQPWAEEATEA